MSACHACGGKGCFYTPDESDGSGGFDQEPCMYCEGTGHTPPQAVKVAAGGPPSLTPEGIDAVWTKLIEAGRAMRDAWYSAQAIESQKHDFPGEVEALDNAASDVDDALHALYGKPFPTPQADAKANLARASHSLAPEGQPDRTGWIKCETCFGTGLVHSHNPHCWDCDGSGKRPPTAAPEGSTLGEDAPKVHALGSVEYQRRAEKYGEEVAAIMQARDAAIARRNEMDAARSLAVHKLDRVRYVVEQFGLSCCPPDAHEAVSNALHALRSRAEAAEKALANALACLDTEAETLRRVDEAEANLAAAQAERDRMREALTRISETSSYPGHAQDIVAAIGIMQAVARAALSPTPGGSSGEAG